MSEILVVLKSPRQRAVEGYLCLAVPAAVAALCRFAVPSAWSMFAPVVTFASYFMVPLLGSVAAKRFGLGERVTHEAAQKAAMDRYLSRSPLTTIFWTVLAMTVWMFSIFWSFFPFDRLAVVLTAAGSLAFGIFTGLLLYFNMRRQRRLLTMAIEEQWPQQTVRDWLPGFLALHYACFFLGMGIGFVAALRFGEPYNVIVFMAGLVGGMLIETVVKARGAPERKRQILWIDIDFFAALGLAALQLGIPFSFAAALLSVLENQGGPATMLIWGAAGFGFGCLVTMLGWAVGKSSAARSRGQKA